MTRDEAVAILESIKDLTNDSGKRELSAVISALKDGLTIFSETSSSEKPELNAKAEPAPEPEIKKSTKFQPIPEPKKFWHNVPKLRKKK